ncbi:MAG: hypothetical protein KBT36_00595 [Kurthia sp.]|nr:hypothetical protein [Candidatus Kurthia equi]
MPDDQLFTYFKALYKQALNPYISSWSHSLISTDGENLNYESLDFVSIDSVEVLDATHAKVQSKNTYGEKEYRAVSTLQRNDQFQWEIVDVEPLFLLNK